MEKMKEKEEMEELRNALDIKNAANILHVSHRDAAEKLGLSDIDIAKASRQDGISSDRVSQKLNIKVFGDTF